MSKASLVTQRQLLSALSSGDFQSGQFLADMLGVRRSGVTVAAGILQKQQFIRYSRGMIHILDRAALKHIACECYQAGLDDYRALLGEPNTNTSDSAIRQGYAQGTP